MLPSGRGASVELVPEQGLELVVDVRGVDRARAAVRDEPRVAAQERAHGMGADLRGRVRLRCVLRTGDGARGHGGDHGDRSPGDPSKGAHGPTPGSP